MESIQCILENQRYRAKDASKFSITSSNKRQTSHSFCPRKKVKSGNLDKERQAEHARGVVAEWFRQKKSDIVKEVAGLDPSLREECIRNTPEEMSKD